MYSEYIILALIKDKIPLLNIIMVSFIIYLIKKSLPEKCINDILFARHRKLT